jgi:hypothetical protein
MSMKSLSDLQAPDDRTLHVPDLARRVIGTFMRLYHFLARCLVVHTAA